MDLATLYQQVARAVYDHRGPKEIQPAQWSALRYFGLVDDKARTVTGLANYLGITKGPASRAAASLKRRGYLSSSRHSNDGRIHVFTLTKAGELAIRQDPLRRFAAEIDNLPEAHRARLAQTLNRLSKAYGLSFEQ